MVKGLLHLLEGYRTVYAASEHTARALTCLYTSGYPHYRIRNESDGGVSFRIAERYADGFLRMCEKESIPIRVDKAKGVPALYRRYRLRWGIPVGAVMFALTVLLSCSVVWEVEVTGNEKLDEKQIVRMLSDYGFGVGTFFGKIDFDVLQNEFLMTTDEIAWISVNMVGTVAHVQVRENLGGRHPDDTSGAVANIIAAEDGQITEVQLRKGKAAVAINDVVQKGDLLISGVIAVGEDGLRYEYADGRVFARVNRQITVEIAKKQEKKVYTGEETVRKSIIFFGKEIKLFRKSSIDNPTYDTILSEKNLSLPGNIALPVWIREERDLAYVMVPCTMTDTEAYVEAMKRYREELDALLMEAEIESVTVEHYSDEHVYRITANLVCTADIATTVPVTTS